MLLGWIKLHRQLLDNWIMTEPEALSVWVRFLLEANHDTKKKMLNGSLVEIKRGQLVFGLEAFSARSGVSIAKLRRYIKLLESDGMINRLKTAKYSIITIASFDSYQSLDRQTTSKEQSNDKQIATPKECKNEKNVKKIDKRFTPPTDIETVSYFEEKGSTASEAEKFWFFYDSKNWMVGKSKMKRWQSAASGWIKRNKTESKDIMQISNDSDWHLQDQGF